MPLTNTQLLTHLSENAKVGPVIQLVLITALDNYSKLVLRSGPGFLGGASAMVSEDAWRAACQEIQDTLASRDQIPAPSSEGGVDLDVGGDALSLLGDMLSMLQDLHNNFGWDELTTSLEDVQERAGELGVS